MKNEDWHVQSLAIGIIRQKDLGTREVIDGLLAALQDPNSDVRAAAAEKLCQAVWRQDTTDEQGRPVLWVGARFPVSGNPTAAEALRSALNDSSSRVRGAAARLLPAFPMETDRSIPLLIAQLKDPAASVRAAAALALAIEATRDREPAVRLAAFEILGEVPAKSAVPIREVMRCLGDPHAEVRAAAATVLGIPERSSGRPFRHPSARHGAR